MYTWNTTIWSYILHYKCLLLKFSGKFLDLNLICDVSYDIFIVNHVPIINVHMYRSNIEEFLLIILKRGTNIWNQETQIYSTVHMTILAVMHLKVIMFNLSQHISHFCGLWPPHFNMDKGYNICEVTETLLAVTV